MMQYLKQLSLQHFRNFNNTQLDFPEKGACIFGRNGSGKTNILEAIYFMGHCRSFRINDVRQLIQHQEKEFLLYAELYNPQEKQIYKLGLRRDRQGNADNRFSNKNATTVDFAKAFPILFLYPESHRLFTQGPSQRRQLIDWGMFHVEHGFYPTWLEYKRVLKNRNILLRNKQNYSVIKAWDQQFVILSQKIDNWRKAYVAELQNVLIPILNELLPEFPIQLHYQAGWDTTNTLSQLLRDHYTKDIQRGHTYYGPQRADLLFKPPAPLHATDLSRGQQKILLFALRLAQGYLLKQQVGKNACYLLDDLSAELDAEHIEIVLHFLKKLDAQIIFTCIDKKKLSLDCLKEFAMFHVEHGDTSVM